MAASAKEAASGIDGIIQWMAYPATNTVAKTSPSASSRMGALRFHSSSRGVRLPSLNSSGAMNSTKNSSGSKDICIPVGITAAITPSPIWIRGTGTKGINRFTMLETAISPSIKSTARNVSTPINLP
ncbi:hypothetical protein D3C85_1535760 [compost metagenome]